VAALIERLGSARAAAAELGDGVNARSLTWLVAGQHVLPGTVALVRERLRELRDDAGEAPVSKLRIVRRDERKGEP
jgi:hypothetical protein